MTMKKTLEKGKVYTNITKTSRKEFVKPRKSKPPKKKVSLREKIKKVKIRKRKIRRTDA